MNGYILSHEDAMALCTHAARLLEAESWEEAKCVCTVLARTAGTLAEAQLALYMANNSIKNEDALLVHLSYADASVLEQDPLLKTALFYADPALAAKLRGAVTVKHDEPNPALAEEIARLQQELSSLAAEHTSVMCDLQSINPDMDPARHSAAMASLHRVNGDINRLSYTLSHNLGDAVLCGMAEEILDPGMSFRFGKYVFEANAARTDSISWQVLGKDDEGILAISESILDVLPVNNINRACTWGGSYLKHWLNTIFLEHAFSPRERLMLGDVEDLGKVFILSHSEISAYTESSDLQWIAPNTNYADAKADYAGCRYWLRPEGETDGYGYGEPLMSSFPYVDESYTFGNMAHVFRKQLGVRPAIYLKFK